MNQTQPTEFCLSDFIAKRDKEQRQKIANNLPELIDLENILLNAPASVVVKLAETIHYQDIVFPIYEIVIGTEKRVDNCLQFEHSCPLASKHNHLKQPHLLLVGGVHGIERIGARVLVSLLSTWLKRLSWEKSLQKSLEHMAITFVPIANPVGMYLNQRGNGNGVDLMRNAPINARDKTIFLLGGHRLSSKLLWYRGKKEVMEVENQVLKAIVERLCQQSAFLISLDCHSGFGFHDQIWFPYAYRRKPMSDIAPLVALKDLFYSGYPHNRYVFEPQSLNYLTHGDLWDYLYKNHQRLKQQNQQGVINGNETKLCTFIPLTLELGSWTWLRKKPSQIFSMEGLFNPMADHRQQRTLRRHLPFLDFLRHACYSFENWLPDEKNKAVLENKAYKLWYSQEGRD